MSIVRTLAFTFVFLALGLGTPWSAGLVRLAEWPQRSGGVMRAEAAEAPVPPSGPPMSLPPNTWVARKPPPKGKGVPGGKHHRLIHNPVDGRIYFLGGDFSGPGGIQSGRNEVYSYSIKDDDWRLEFPYCGPNGATQPSHPDQVGWTWDSTRQLFWMVPGYMFNFKDKSRCAQAGSKLVHSEIMTYDPAKRTWEVPGIPLPYKIPGNHKFVQYDPGTDSLIMFSFGGHTSVMTLDIKRRTWSTKRFPGSLRLGKEDTAFDPEQRVSYVIEPTQAKLYRYAIDRQELVTIADAPQGSPVDTTMPFWDPVNRVLLFPQYGKTSDIRLHVFHPETRTWEGDFSAREPEGIRVRGVSGVFDPYQNVLLILGNRGSEQGDGNPSFFLFRYQKGAVPR